jgi:hypothetical protein
MKGNDSIAVQDLIPSEFEGLPALLRANSDGTPLSGVSSTVLSYASGQIVDAIRGTLSGGVFEWLAEAWCTAEELRKYKTGSKAAAPAADSGSDDEASTLLSLGEHTLSCVARPVVTVTVSGHSFRIDGFSVELAAELHAAALEVRNGYIIAIRGGDGLASATLKYGDQALHDVTTKEIRVPGKIEFAAPGHKIL